MPQHLHFEENVKGHIWNWAHHGRMMPYKSSAQDQGNAWRIKVRDNIPYSIQSCMSINRSERQRASRSVDVCYPKLIASYCWGTSLQVLLSYIHTSSRVCYQLSCKSESETLHKAAERQSYKELVTYIRNELLSNPQVLPMIDTALWLIIYVLPWYQLSQRINQ